MKVLNMQVEKIKTKQQVNWAENPNSTAKNSWNIKNVPWSIFCYAFMILYTPLYTQPRK